MRALAKVDLPPPEPEVDAASGVELVYPGAVTGSAIWDLAAQDPTMLWAWVGSMATASSPASAVLPNLDNRVIIIPWPDHEEYSMTRPPTADQLAGAGGR